MSTLRRVLITDPVDEICIKILRENGVQVDYKPKLPVTEILQQIKEADGLIVRSGTTVTAEMIKAGENLKIIGRAGVGVDNVDCDAATRFGVIVVNTPVGNTVSAAEHTCAMITTLSRFIPEACASLKAGKWDRAKFMGNELSGKTLAIIGLGRIGREVAFRMQSFGMKTIGFDPLVPPEVSQTFGVKGLSLEEIWPLADYITLHVPLIPQTKNLVSAAALEKCRKGVRIVNVARGGIIDEAALFDALESGKCAGVGLDVYIEEPPKDFTLINHPKVVCTPHLGASTYEAQSKVAEEIAQQFVEFKNGGNLAGAVNAPLINESTKEGQQPWANLIQNIGRLAAVSLTLADVHGLRVEVERYGVELHKDSKLLLTAALVGFLKSKFDRVGLVNATLFASESGIQAKYVDLPADPNYGIGVGFAVISNNTKLCHLRGTLRSQFPLLTHLGAVQYCPGVPIQGYVTFVEGEMSAITDAFQKSGTSIRFIYPPENGNGMYAIGVKENVVADILSFPCVHFE